MGDFARDLMTGFGSAFAQTSQHQDTLKFERQKLAQEKELAGNKLDFERWSKMSDNDLALTAMNLRQGHEENRDAMGWMDVALRNRVQSHQEQMDNARLELDKLRESHSDMARQDELEVQWQNANTAKGQLELSQKRSDAEQRQFIADYAMKTADMLVGMKFKNQQNASEMMHAAATVMSTLAGHAMNPTLAGAIPPASAFSFVSDGMTKLATKMSDHQGAPGQDTKNDLVGIADALNAGRNAIAGGAPGDMAAAMKQIGDAMNAGLAAQSRPAKDKPPPPPPTVEGFFGKIATRKDAAALAGAPSDATPEQIVRSPGFQDKYYGAFGSHVTNDKGSVVDLGDNADIAKTPEEKRFLDLIDKQLMANPGLMYKAMPRMTQPVQGGRATVQSADPRVAMAFKRGVLNSAQSMIKERALSTAGPYGGIGAEMLANNPTDDFANTAIQNFLGQQFWVDIGAAPQAAESRP